MRRILIALCALLVNAIITPPASAEPFVISSEESGFSVVGKFTGSYAKKWSQIDNLTKQAIEVKLEEATILRSLGCPNKSADNVISIRAFLGVPVPGKTNFDVINYSEPINVNQLLQVGETATLKKVKLLIPIQGVPPSRLKEAWLGFSIYSEKENATKNSGGTCYAHSSVLLFNREKSGRENR